MRGASELFQKAQLTDAGYLRPLKRNLPDIFVSAGTLEAALTLASELYLALEDRNYRVSLATDAALSRRPAVDHRGLVVKDDPYTDTRERWGPRRPSHR